MDVSEFVAEALRQVLEGVRKAQSLEGGENINANIGKIPLGGNVINAGDFGMVTRIDFDIAVSAETTGKAGGNLKVFGVGLEGGGEHKHGSANRISFSVPIRLPDGDKARSEKVRSDKESATTRSLEKLATMNKRRVPL